MFDFMIWDNLDFKTDIYYTGYIYRKICSKTLTLPFIDFTKV